MKIFKNNFFNFVKIKKKWKYDEFCQNIQFLAFVIFVSEISNKHFRKLDKSLRNFCSLQFSAFVTVFKIFGFKNHNNKQWSCDILERYCTVSKCQL